MKQSHSTTNTTASHSAALLSFWLIALAAITGLTLLIFGVLWQQENAHQDAEARRNVQWRVEALAQRLTQRFSVYQNLLQGLANDVNLARLLAENNPQRLAEYEAGLTRLIPDALRVRLLKPGHDTVDLQADPPLSFASLDLLRAAKTSAAPLPLEVHQAQNPKPHPVLVGVVLVRDRDGVERGLVHLALNASVLQNVLNELPAQPAWIALQQQVNGKPVTLFSRAAISHPGDAADGARPLTGSKLQLAYAYQSAARDEEGGGLTLLIALGLLLLLQVLVLGAHYVWLRQTLLHDHTLLVKFVEQSLGGHPPVAPTPALRELTTTLTELGKQLRNAPARPFDAATAGPKLAQVESTDPATVAVPRERSNLASAKLAPLPSTGVAVVNLSLDLFHAHEIRGRVGQTLLPSVVRELGQALGSQAQEQNQSTLIVARDARASSEALSTALVSGLTASGCSVIDVGAVATPLCYFAAYQNKQLNAVRVSSERPSADYNGLAVILGGEIVAGAGLLALRERIVQDRMREGSGTARTQDILSGYLARVGEDISMARPLKVVLDCGNGLASLVAPQLFRNLGCSVVELSCNFDLRTPHHFSDPSRAENLQALQKAVLAEQANLGLGFSNDGDRVGVVDSQGRVIWPDRVLMLLATDVLSRHPGSDIVFDVQCSRTLPSQILQNSGRPVMSAAGVVALQAKMRETEALLGGSWSGQLLFRERWYGFEDGFYAGARLLEILALDPRDSAEVFEDFPECVSTPELLLMVPEGEQHALLERLRQQAALLGEAKLVTIDGLRAEFRDGWGLVRAAGALSALSFRFEADDEAALARIEGLYRTLLTAVAPELNLPF